MASSEPKLVTMAYAKDMPPAAKLAYHHANVERLTRELEGNRSNGQAVIDAARRIIAELVWLRADAARGGSKLTAEQASELELQLARATGILVLLGVEVGDDDEVIGRYLGTASADELKVLDELAELDRKHGNKPTPAA